MARILLATSLVLGLQATACTRSSSASSEASNIRVAECAAVMKVLERFVDEMDALERTPTNTLPETVNLLERAAKAAGRTQRELDQLHVEDLELTHRLKAFQDAFFVFQSMLESTINNAKGGFADALTEQLAEVERFQAKADAAGEAIDDYCE